MKNDYENFMEEFENFNEKDFPIYLKSIRKVNKLRKTGNQIISPAQGAIQVISPPKPTNIRLYKLKSAVWKKLN